MNQRAGEALGETLRPLLIAAGYTREGGGGRRLEDVAGPLSAKTIAARFRLSVGEPLRTVIRFLFLGERVDEQTRPVTLA